MRRLPYLLFLLFLTTVRAEEPIGVRFFSGPWQAVLTEAQRLNKPVFVDVYASWCPPCRRMAQEAFPNPAVGAALNDRYISYQIDAEAGEGFALARQYGVSSYPTTLYLTPNGELVHRSVGYGGVKALVQQIDIVSRMPKLRRLLRRR